MVLVLLPGGDPTSDALATVGRGVVARRADPNVWWFTVLDGEAVDRAAIDEFLTPAEPWRRSTDPSNLVLYFGHGTTDALGQPPLIDKSNVARTRGLIIVAMACSSLAGLGTAAVRLGAQAFIGFARPVVVPLSGTALSLAPWGVCADMLLLGFDVEDAVTRAEAAFTDDADRIVREAGVGNHGFELAVLHSHIHLAVAASLDYEGDGRAVIDPF